MSALCHMELTCRKRDAARFKKLGFEILDDGNLEGCVLADMGSGTPGDGDNSGSVMMCDEQANHGHFDEMPQNIPYVGWHGSGGEYGPHKFACDGKRYVEIETSEDGEPVVRVSSSGKVDKQALKLVKEYRTCLKRAEAAMQSKAVPRRKDRP